MNAPSFTPGRNAAGPREEPGNLSSADPVGALAADADGLASALADELRVPTVVVTLGESECIAHAAVVTRRYSAQKTVAVDTTGASDAFTATFAAHLTAGASGADAVSAAQSAAAWTIAHPGCHRSMPAPG